MDLILFQFAPHAILVKIRGVNSEEHGSQIPLVGVYDRPYLDQNYLSICDPYA